MLNLGEIRTEILNLAGLDLTTAEANALANEGDAELCTRAGWSRAEVSLGNTIAGQAVYALPATVFRPLELYVDDVPYVATDKQTVRRISDGQLRRRAKGLWFLTDAQAVELLPVPTTAGKPITASAVVYPTPMTADAHEPGSAIPFRRGIIHHVAAVSLGGAEDSRELHAYHRDRFEDYVVRLRAHRLSRTGSGPRQIRVEA